MRQKYLLSAALMALLAIALLLFRKDPITGQSDDSLLAFKKAVVQNYADLVYANYIDAFDQATVLKAAIETFVAQPTATRLQATRAAWRAAREPYGQTEAYRFYGGPIDGKDGVEGWLNAWPLDESYVDYVRGKPNAGIINDPQNYPQLTPELLLSLNENGSEENISIGFHAIEFLLWGQDFRDDGPGDRPYTDYIDGGTAPHPQRRARYLRICAELLVQHLRKLCDAWAPAQTANYCETFLRLPVDQALQKMVTGIAFLSKSELAGERLYTAYDNANQEDEHSCFSDNTHRDIITNARALQNVYNGIYTKINGEKISGASLRDLLDRIAPGSDAGLNAQMERALAAVQAIPVPFDQAIVHPESRQKVLAAVLALQKLGDQFAGIAETLGLSRTTDVPGEKNKSMQRETEWQFLQKQG